MSATAMQHLQAAANQLAEARDLSTNDEQRSAITRALEAVEAAEHERVTNT